MTSKDLSKAERAWSHLSRDIAVRSEARSLAAMPGSAGVVCVGSEDEMITLHQCGKYLATLYASCPEQASDFVKEHGRREGMDLEAWRRALFLFRGDWRSKYPDEE